MAIPMQAISNIHSTPSPSAAIVSPRPAALRPTLPNKKVTSDTIEDAYVSFILYCNPAVSLETDTTALRESFRAPPKSDGKSFSTFSLFELIKQLEKKELKTWAELALKLGVTPPDQEKGQSSQKIQQYAVRLKRWMHSMHVNAFFDYLLDNPHPYWNQIPTDMNPLCEDGRDGVAAEDDMALRALLPQIRPRRGRRKPEDDGLNKSPSQRPRLNSPIFNGEPGPPRPEGIEPWTAHPDGRNTFLFPPADQARSSILPGSEPAFPWPSDTQTPLTAYPQSAMTPVNGRAFWADPLEPRSAITPSKAKLLGRRHGAKVVSSAWRSGSSTTNGKTRGRPPINRISESPLSAFPDTNVGFQTTPVESSTPLSAQATNNPVPLFTTERTSMPIPNSSAPPQQSRAARPGRLSLQVPPRVGGSVRLATPPLPVVMINGESTPNSSESHQTPNTSTSANGPDAPKTVDLPSRSDDLLPPDGVPSQTTPSRDDADTTNVNEVESLFVSELLIADWCNASGNKISPCGFDEAVAMSRTIIGNMSKQALTPEAFLINLAALAGGSILQRGIRVSITRLEEGSTHNRYACKWALRYGSLRGDYSITESVPRDLWKKKAEKEPQLSDSSDSTEQGNETAAAEHWKRKYEDLAHTVRANHQRATDLKIKVLESFKDAPPTGEA